ncbi:MAG: SusC/RagA family TonB-linked outer membrane protein [Gemmatimonadaceae bacterium]
MRLSVFTRSSLSLVALLAAALAPQRLAAQATGAIGGLVVDSTNRQPIPGVAISIPGTGHGTITDEAGRFSMRAVPAGTVTLRAQRLGYGPTEQTISVVSDQTAVANFTMAPIARVLAEVVATGYGATIRRELSSSVSSIQGEDLANTPVAGVDAALQGKAPGVQVVQNAGNPGAGITVRVRGAASISASNQPLWVIDGVPLLREDFSQFGFLGGQDITAVTGISPDEIESIDILKDAASAAIYGSRAANGVVMITTKRGRAARPRFSFNMYTGQQDISRKMELTNSTEFIEFINEARANDGLSLRYTPGVDDAVSTDWQEAALRNSAPVTDLFLSVDGGSERVRYFVSGSVFDQTGIVLGSGYDRQSIRANVDFDPNTRIGVKTSFTLSREMHDRIVNDNTIEGVFANAIAEVPMFPVRQPDGRFTDPTDRVGIGGNTPLGYINPVAVAEFNFNESRALRSFGNIEATVRLTDHLRLNARGGYDVLNLRDLAWGSPRVVGSSDETVGGFSVLANNTAQRFTLESYLGYDFANSFAAVNFTAGSGVEWNTEENEYLAGQGFPHPDFQYPGNAGDISAYDGDRTGYNLVSFFSRANATFNDRYLLSASIRADGSSRFGEENRYGIFPAVSVGWIMTDEPFLAGLARRADVKLRASYGETGNQDIGDDFAPIARYGEAKYAGEPGIAPVNIANAELKWETNKEYDVGVDVGLVDGRVLLVADWYLKLTEDLLLRRPLTSTSGFTTYWDNIGNIENRGWELGLTTTNFAGANDGFSWETNFNISWNENTMTKLEEPFTSGFDGINRYEEGLEMGAFYTVRFTGVDPQTGDVMCFDEDQDGATCDDADDRVVVGSPFPDYWGGLTNTFGWKGFDLRTFVQFSQGGEIYNGLRAYADDGGLSRFDNKLKHVTRRWRQPGDITDVPRASARCNSNACLTTSRWIEDASYVRLQEVTLGYRIPARFAGMANLSDARFFVSGRNLKTWQDFLGFNPDANSAGSSSNTTIANEFYSYPLARTWTVGVSGSF